MTEPTDHKSPLQTAVETLVYAPIGLLFEGAELLPQLVEKGKSHATMAKMVGQFAVQKASGDATKVASRLQDQAAGILDFIAGTVVPPSPEPGPPPAPAAAPAEPAPAEDPPSVPKRPGAAKEAARRVAAAAPAETPSSSVNQAAGEDAPVQATLAIPDYDGLSASQVVNRLAGLTSEELEAVRSYELATRGRKTILSKIAQLQSKG